MGVAGVNGRFYWRKSVADLATEFYSLTSMDPKIQVRTVSQAWLIGRHTPSGVEVPLSHRCFLVTVYVGGFAQTHPEGTDRHHEEF